MIWLKLAAAAAAFLLALWAWDNYIADRYRAQGKTDGVREERAATLQSLRARFGVETIEEAAALLKRSTDAVRELKSTRDKRLQDSERALQQAEADVQTIAGEVQRLRALKPEFPNDSCASACSLLRGPL